MLIVAGLHVPVMPLVDVVGNAGAVLFWQIGAIGVNAGVTCGFTKTVSEPVVAHWPAFGVKI